eukprot:3291251-Prymnesium_polylepis.1
MGHQVPTLDDPMGKRRGRLQRPVPSDSGDDGSSGPSGVGATGGGSGGPIAACSSSGSRNPATQTWGVDAVPACARRSV